MRIAVLAAAFIGIVVGVVGLVSPDTLTAIRQQYISTQASLYAAGIIRIATGLVLLMFAPASRAPRVLRVCGALVCLQGLAAMLYGVERASAILAWEAEHRLLMRCGALVALASGAFVVFAASPACLCRSATGPTQRTKRRWDRRI